MDDYIDRQAAIKDVYAIHTVDTEYDAALIGRLDVRYVLEALPSADVVSVVRCKDCKYWNPCVKECAGFGKWFGLDGEWGETDFCSRGERMDGEHERK